MSPPEHFAPVHLFNPWMRWRDRPDAARAREQWEALRATIEATGARVETIRPAVDGTMMTFTRDAAVVARRREVVLLRGTGGRALVEPPLYGRWFRRAGYEVRTLPRGLRLEGGNVMLGRGRALIGVSEGSDGRAARAGARLLARAGITACTGIPLRGGRFGHLDRALADLDGRGWLLYPGAFAKVDLSSPAWRRVLGGRPVIEVERDEAVRLVCNVVVVAGVVIGSVMSARLRARIERLGLHTSVTPLGEFARAGGGAHCLTMELDPPRRTA